MWDLHRSSCNGTLVFRPYVPECVAKGSCFLSWGSGGGGLFARRFGSFFSNRVVALSMGKVKKGHVLQRVKVHFAWQACGFVAVRRKLLRGSLALSMRKVRKGDVL